MPRLDVRPLEPDDLEAAWRLGRDAFASRSASAPDRALRPVDGLTRWGAFDERGRLVGKAIDLHHERWWGGRTSRAADVGGVAVAPEARGLGVARALLTALLDDARGRGAATSALFPTTAGPYRALGWEVVGEVTTLDVPTAELAPPPVRTSARAGGAQDVAAAQAAYETVARTADGLLHLFAPRVDPLEGADGLSIVEDGDQVVAWALWRREGGYGHDGVLDLHDVVAATPAGADGLVALLHGWSSVAPTLRLRTLPGCALATRLPLERARVHEREAWMHRPVDLVRLVRDRGWAPHLRASLVLRVADPVAPWNTGTWSLEVADGRGDAHRTDALPAATLGPRGLALLLCGTTRADALALAGLLDVAPGHEPSELDVLQPAGRAQVLDSF